MKERVGHARNDICFAIDMVLHGLVSLCCDREIVVVGRCAVWCRRDVVAGVRVTKCKPLKYRWFPLGIDTYDKIPPIYGQLPNLPVGSTCDNKLELILK
jgi:hypothetical protein